MKDYAMIIDYKYCTGCHACEVTCQNEHNFNENEWGIKLTEHGPTKFESGWVWNYVPVPSKLCDLCVEKTSDGSPVPCVLHCLGQCMQVVPVKELADILPALGEEVAVFIP